MAEWIDDFGQKLVDVHEDGGCWGEFCPIHNPSDHPLSLMPQRWDGEQKVMTRICTHKGIAHVDADDRARGNVRCYRNCDGCCKGVLDD